MSDRRDRSEIMKLADMFMPIARCVGGHVVYDGYVCSWCNSNQPTGGTGYCVKEAVMAPSCYRFDLPNIGRRKWKEAEPSYE